MERSKIIEFLRRLDDPEWPESPAGYRETEAEASFASLVARISSRFSARLDVDRAIQDSAQYGRIEVPRGAAACGTRIVVLVSKFKPLAMVAADNPGAFLGTNEAIEEGELDASDLEKLEQSLVESGYVPIPEEVLSNRYDGATRLLFHGSGEPSWWDRYFGTF
ncbi:hypothetical protein O7632_04865 [Solwaraspora sp. WMMD406]|uniref:hypothetical protein n=1 Tax=Solwaraspora sp. WMMD406 TaxID=3016095 RepID=UPI00241644E3|nr:hypothetical protein [Solwaraspora sp. WMMD406]MDG4763441.1 hypothetical protein [Solwaraspora sp. WMMD406]